MVQLALDANILIYAELSQDHEKGRRAKALIKRSVGGVIPAQALGEVLRATQRKAPALFDSVERAVDEVYRISFRVPPTTEAVVAVAAELARERKLQFWDCVICVASAQAGATYLFSEDMQDGSDIRGLKIINPFDSRNDSLMEHILL